MKKLWTSTLIALAISLFFTACSFKLGDNTSAAKAETTNKAKTDEKSKTDKTKKDAKSNPVKSNGLRTEDDLATSEDDPDLESDTSQTTDFIIKRSYYALDENRPEDMMTRDGDYDYFKKLESGGTAGFYYSTKPQKAQYVLWDGEVIAGPLTTDEQIKEAAATISQNMRNEHEMRMNLIKNRPTGILGPSRVYDEKGNLIREQ